MPPVTKAQHLPPVTKAQHLPPVTKPQHLPPVLVELLLHPAITAVLRALSAVRLYAVSAVIGMEKHTHSFPSALQL
jgi:hypothetical protein